MVHFVNKTSRDKGGACRNEVETVQSNIVRYYPRSKLSSAGYFSLVNFSSPIVLDFAS